MMSSVEDFRRFSALELSGKCFTSKFSFCSDAKFVYTREFNKASKQSNVSLAGAVTEGQLQDHLDGHSRFLRLFHSRLKIVVKQLTSESVKKLFTRNHTQVFFPHVQSVSTLPHKTHYNFLG